MKQPIKVTDASELAAVPVRRRNPQGKYVGVSASIPEELNQTINGMVAKTTKSRSLIITELLRKGLE